MRTSTLETSTKSVNDAPTKHSIVVKKTYENNKASDFTEKLQELDQSFKYEDCGQSWWGPAELSIFYGTELFRQASDTQKLKLNHLYWITQYNQTAATEANAILYNQITEGVFRHFKGYNLLCDELSLETEQEHHHIHAFHNIAYRTRKSIFQKATPKTAQSKLSSKTLLRSRKKRFDSKQHQDVARIPLPHISWTNIAENAMREASFLLTSAASRSDYSTYLSELERKGCNVPIQSSGLLGQVLPRGFNRLVTIGFGTSPFLACFFYATRYLANILLKNYEYHYVRYYRDLQQKNEFTPVPTEVSYFHLMDESFHTTTSQVISQELYREFAAPTAYELLTANLILLRGQKLMFGGISGAIPAVFKTDRVFLEPLYAILTSSIFGFDRNEALHWLKLCLTEENDGFHSNLKHHESLCKSMKQAFAPLEYLWPVNRELKILDQSKSIPLTIKKNKAAIEELEKI